MIISGHVKWKNDKEQQVVFPCYDGVQKVDEILNEFVKVQLDTGIYGWCCSKLIEREVIEDLRFDLSLVLAEDFDFFLQVYDRVDKICFLKTATYFYLQDAENNSVKKDYDIDYISQLYLWRKWREFLNKNGVFQGENKYLLQERISNYIYFSIFYSRMSEIKMVYQNFQKENVINDIEIPTNFSMKKCILWLLKENKIDFVILILKLYRKLKRIAR